MARHLITLAARLMARLHTALDALAARMHSTQMRVAIAHHEREVRRIDDEAGAMRIAQLQHERTAAMLRRRLADLA